MNMKKLLTILITLIFSICLINVNTNKTSAEGEEITITGHREILYMRANETTSINVSISNFVSGHTIQATKIDGNVSTFTTSISKQPTDQDPTAGISFTPGVGWAIARISIVENPSVYKDVLIYAETGSHGWAYDDYVKGSGKNLEIISNDEFAKFTKVQIKDDKTGQTGELTEGTHYSKQEGCIVINLFSSFLEPLPVGSYELQIVSQMGTAVAQFDIKNPDPTPEPQPKDESCEKVIGPTWHWNESKGICEEYATVGTSTR